MKLKNIHMTNVGGIPDLKVTKLHPQINIICGENGVGKTNILDSISYMFSTYANNSITLKKGTSQGRIFIEFNNPEPDSFERLIDKYSLEEFRYIDHQRIEIQNKLIYLKVNRSFEYKKEHSLQIDISSEEKSSKNSGGVTNNDLKNWLIIRKGFDQINLTETQRKNSDLITKCFSIINQEYSFSSAKTDFEVYVKTPTSSNSELHFENLSSGFKSTLFILLGIIKELDQRFNNIITAQEYDGLILIDEIELHLHPEWQSNICSILKSVFPYAQFFITTHSPHVVQTANHNEVIALQRIDEKIIRRDLPTSEYGYQGWTIEEILEDVMGMQDIRSTKFKEIKKLFDDALDAKNKEQAQLAYAELDKMLHPHYPLRPVFKLQLDSLGN